MNGHGHGGHDQPGQMRQPSSDSVPPSPMEGGTVGEANPGLSESMRCPKDHDLCERCQHAMDPHIVVATGTELEEGGIILCPELTCVCWSSWCPPDMDSQKIRIPDITETEEIRAMIQRL